MLYCLTFIQSLHIWSYQLLVKYKGPEMDGKASHNYIPDRCHKLLHKKPMFVIGMAFGLCHLC